MPSRVFSRGEFALIQQPRLTGGLRQSASRTGDLNRSRRYPCPLTAIARVRLTVCAVGAITTTSLELEDHGQHTG